MSIYAEAESAIREWKAKLAEEVSAHEATRRAGLQTVATLEAKLAETAANLLRVTGEYARAADREAKLAKAQERHAKDLVLLRECIKTRGELGERMIEAEAREAKLREGIADLRSLRYHIVREHGCDQGPVLDALMTLAASREPKVTKGADPVDMRGALPPSEPAPPRGEAMTPEQIGPITREVLHKALQEPTCRELLDHPHDPCGRLLNCDELAARVERVLAEAWWEKQEAPPVALTTPAEWSIWRAAVRSTKYEVLRILNGGEP